MARAKEKEDKHEQQKRIEAEEALAEQLAE
eukprot:SAG22_NODE_20888_length_262_cov_0.429448_2_plen_29_part_01